MTSSGVFGLNISARSDGVVLAILAVVGDQAQGFVAQAGHARKGFHFLLGKLRRLKHGALHDFAGIADQQEALVAAAFERQLHALDDAHARQFLQQRFAFGLVRLGSFRGFDECLDGFRLGALQFQELGALLRVDHRGGDEFGDQMGRSAQPVKVLEQFLNGGDGKIMNDRPKNFDGAGGIFGQRVGNAGSARKFGGAIGEHFRSGAGPGEGGEHGFQRLGQQNARGLFADGGIRIRGKDAERLDAVFRRERGRLAADGKLSFRGRAARTNFFAQRGANFRLPRLPSEHLA